MEEVELEDSMATTSIMHNFIVSNPESVEKFAKALEEAANDPPMPITVDVKFLDDPDEIRECMEKLERAYLRRNAVESRDALRDPSACARTDARSNGID